MDSNTTILQLKKRYKSTREKRGWRPSLKSLAISIALEAGELLEHFQWDEDGKVVRKMEDPKKRQEVILEVGDILNYLCGFADQAGIDMSEAANAVFSKIDKKYPVEMMKEDKDGKYYDEQKKKYRENRE